MICRVSKVKVEIRKYQHEYRFLFRILVFKATRFVSSGQKNYVTTDRKCRNIHYLQKLELQRFIYKVYKQLRQGMSDASRVLEDQ